MAPSSNVQPPLPDSARDPAGWSKGTFDGVELRIRQESDHLLIEDDSQFMRFVLKKILEKNGYRVTLIDDRTLRAAPPRQDHNSRRGGHR